MYWTDEDANGTDSMLSRQSSKTKLHNYKLIFDDSAQIPSTPFINTAFDAQIFLVDGDDMVKILDIEEIELTVRLCFHNENIEDNLSVPLIDVPEGTFSVESDLPLKIAKHKPASVRIKINQLSMNLDYRKFILVVAASTQNGIHVMRAVSSPMFCIQYKLVIEEINTETYIWYQ